MVTFNEDVSYNIKSLQERLSAIVHPTYDPVNMLAVTTIFKTIQGEAPFAGRSAIFLRLAGCNRGSKIDKGCAFCFPVNKGITTINRGKVSIGDLRPGDRLYTFDDKFQVTETTVTKNHRRDVTQTEMVQIRVKKNGKVDRHLITCTREHPFNIRGHGWVNAEDLRPGMKIHHADRRDIQRYLKTVINPMFNADSRRRMMLNKVYPISKLEEKALEFFQRVIPGIKYVGDNAISIGNEKLGYLCPNFIVEGSNKVIEVYDPTFPNYAEPRRTKKQRAAYEARRRMHFATFGYDVEFFTSKDFGTYNRYGSGYEKEFSPHLYADLVRKTRAFMTNGIEIVEVKPISNVTFGTQRQNSAGVKPDTLAVANVTCAPYNHFLIDGMHVHNCDTFFALNADTKIYSVDALVAEITTIAKDMAAPLLVITGGEPMLQAQALLNFLPVIAGSGAINQIQFETNGDLFQTEAVNTVLDLIDEINEEEAEANDDDDPFINIVISPKRTIKEPKTGAFLNLAEQPGVYIRLVISGDKDSVYYTIPQFLLDVWPREAFFISPLTEYKRKPDDNEIVNIVEDIDLEATRRNIARAIDLAHMFGIAVSLQAHSYIGIP